MKVRGDEQSMTKSGSPATTKALSPSDERRVAGTTRADDDWRCSLQTAVDGATYLFWPTLYICTTALGVLQYCLLI